MIPVTRKEQYLNRLTGEEQAIPDEPITRTEQYLARLCGEDTEIPSSPITREEAYLAYLNGENVTLPEPITRLEQFMAFAAEKSETKPTPLTREELYWDKYQGGAVLKDFPGLPASIVTVTDALAKPLDSLKVAITPVQSGSGDPSPDNIRPISGWTGCNVWRTGKNLLDIDTVYGEYKQTDGTYRLTGTQARNAPIGFSKEIIGKQVTFSIYVDLKKEESPTRIFARARIDGTDYDSNAIYAGRKGLISLTFTPTRTNDYVRLLYGSDGGNYFEIDYAQLELGSTATSHKPYTGQDYPITFPSEAGTVYGGTLDVTNGVLTVTDGYVADLGSLTWTTAGSGRHNASILDAKIFPNVQVARAKCEQYKTISANSISDNDYSFCLGVNNLATIQINDSRYNGESASDFKEHMSGTKLVYELATPKTYQLTPTEVQMLLGTNNIWADTGDILEGKYYGKRSSATRQMLNTLQGAREITETIEPEEQEENDER